MNLDVRLVCLAVVLLVAGCSTTGVDSGPTETPVSATVGDVPDDAPATPVGDRRLQQTPVTVTRVVDGDTIDVRFPDGRTDTVRLLGIDTPEVRAENEPDEYEGVPATASGRECLADAGRNASAYVDDRLAGANVTLAFDPRSDRRGGYDRLLGYVYVDGTNLNRELVAAGHARVYETDFLLRAAFEASEDDAQSAPRGLWACRSTTS